MGTVSFNMQPRNTDQHPIFLRIKELLEASCPFTRQEIWLLTGMYPIAAAPYPM
jgi:hypothetical protein